MRKKLFVLLWCAFFVVMPAGPSHAEINIQDNLRILKMKTESLMRRTKDAILSNRIKAEMAQRRAEDMIRTQTTRVEDMMAKNKMKQEASKRMQEDRMRMIKEKIASQKQSLRNRTTTR